jgi:MOSC domain-containing protein YiiM
MQLDSEHLDRAALEVGVGEIRRAPNDEGLVELIVRRPVAEAREVVDEATLDTLEGLVGDNWATRGSSGTPDGRGDPERQLTLMNARAAALLARTRDRWPLAGDQVYVDLDLSGANLPPGTRLQLGGAIVEVTAEPHTGCAKFSRRFGVEALRFVNSPVGRELNLRGINAKVIAGGVVRTGDAVRKHPG